ncbi:TPA: ABC transporter permease [Stenotrophomonas maltophilia]|uniref:ABC transporter permease n=1 Tax=Stenotrophomonas maltophilia TaxID=40324 RepID=UPI002A98DCAF|nr:ABC transporter permease [Stenotrophomonas maltophilia]HEL4227500.1 ABC transporter permease [Stenotrophomonas maltophilia]
MSALWRSLRQTLMAVLCDRYAIVVMVGAVILYSFFYPAAYRHQVADNLPVLVVDQDHSATSRELLRKLDALRVARVVGQPADIDSARQQLEAGHAEGIVLIPANLERDILRGHPAKLVLLGNGAYLGRASWVLGSVADALGAFGRDAVVGQAAFMGAPQAPPVTLVQRPLYNTQEGYGSAIVPGVAELIVHQTLLMGIGVLLGGRRLALGRRLRFDLPTLAGMAMGFGLIGLFGLFWYAGFTAWVQDYPRGGNPLGQLLGGTLFIAATVVFGLFVGSFFRTRERAFQYIIATSIPLFFLANLSWPAVMTPQPLVWLAQLLPTTSGINLMVRLNQMDASLADVSHELITLTVLLLLYGSLATWRLLAKKGAKGIKS